MYCKNCGKKIDDNSPTCSHCGSAQGTVYVPYTPEKKDEEGCLTKIFLSIVEIIIFIWIVRAIFGA